MCVCVCVCVVGLLVDMLGWTDGWIHIYTPTHNNTPLTHTDGHGAHRRRHSGLAASVRVYFLSVSSIGMHLSLSLSAYIHQRFSFFFFLPQNKNNGRAHTHPDTHTHVHTHRHAHIKYLPHNIALTSCSRTGTRTRRSRWRTQAASPRAWSRGECGLFFSFIYLFIYQLWSLRYIYI